MCGRFAQVIKYEVLKKLIDEMQIANSDEQIEINYNVAPTQAVAAVFSKSGERILSFFRWGLIPSWSAELPKFQMINIRSESIFEKPTFKNAVLRRRCLVPANGFYEWRKHDKQPFFVRAKDNDLLYMAGVYDIWTGADGSFVPSLGIITTSANMFMSSIHDRMPVLLQKSDLATWLHPSFHDQGTLGSILKPAPETYLESYAVNKTVNKVGNNTELCWEAVNI